MTLTIPPPIPVLIKASSIPDAWAKATYFVSHHGTASSPDYKNTPTIRTDLKLIIDHPMKDFYTGETEIYSINHIHKIKVPSINFNSVLHPVFLKPVQETGIVTQGIKSIENYIYYEMSRQFADDYHTSLLNNDPDIPPYSYAHRLIYYPSTRYKPIEKIRNLFIPDESPFTKKELLNLVTEHQYLDQLKFIRDELPKRPGSRRIKANLWIPEIDLPTFENQPCLQQIKFEYLGNDSVHISIVFRSWDLFNGWPPNIPGILHLLHTEILGPNNLTCSRLTCNGEDTHIYKANWADAKKIPLQAHQLNEILYF